MAKEVWWAIRQDKRRRYPSGTITTMIVLDASVILKWFVEEVGSRAALQFRHNHITGSNRVAAPELLFYEITNVLIHNKSLPLAAAMAALEDLFDIGIETYSLGKEEYVAALKLARDFRISGYDACYAVLAEKLNCPFVTADQKLYTNLLRSDIKSRVMRLES